MDCKVLTMFKLMVGFCLLISLCMGTAFAQDDELTLKNTLDARTGGENVVKFMYADYDGDGIHEAFALTGSMDTFTGGYTGDIWFVSPVFCDALQTGCSYLDVQMLGDAAPILLSAEEWYGGSGSTSYVWSVVESKPVALENSFFGDFERGEGNEFFAYPSAFDAFSDGTGHTWKRYYFYLDGITMREYGGINISMDELLEFDGAEDLVQNAAGSNYDVTGIIYRSNGRIHVNMTEKGSGIVANQYLTLRYEGAELYEEEIGSGVYELASDPFMAVYPKEFVHPSEAHKVGETAGGIQFNLSKPVQQNAASAVPSQGMPAPTAQLQFGFVQPQATSRPQPTATLPAMKPAQSSQKVQATAGVNVRTQPDLNGKKMGELKAGDTLAYLNETCKDNRGIDWYKVNYEGNTGWVSSRYAKLTGGSPVSTAPGSVSQAGGKQVRIVGGNANIRSGPGLNYGSIGSLKEGRVVKYLGKTSRDSRGVDWYYIDFNGKIGWVSSKYSRIS